MKGIVFMRRFCFWVSIGLGYLKRPENEISQKLAKYEFWLVRVRLLRE